MEKDSLVEAMATCLANATVMYHRTHGAHWCVVGYEFPQWHSKFGEIYDDVYGSLDPIAENIRKIGGFPPYTLSELASCATVPDIQMNSYEWVDLVRDLVRVNDGVIDSLYVAFQEADAVGEEGILNFLAERIDAHQKWNWQLTASLQ